MKCLIWGACLLTLSCMSPNPESRSSDFPKGTWVKVKAETFDGQGKLIGSIPDTAQDCKRYLVVTMDSMEFLDPGTATGEAAKKFARCYSRVKSSYSAADGGGWKRGSDSIFFEKGMLVLVRRYATLSGKEELETRKTYYGSTGGNGMDLSKCDCSGTASP